MEDGPYLLYLPVCACFSSNALFGLVHHVETGVECDSSTCTGMFVILIL